MDGMILLKSYFYSALLAVFCALRATSRASTFSCCSFLCSSRPFRFMSRSRRSIWDCISCTSLVRLATSCLVTDMVREGEWIQSKRCIDPFIFSVKSRLTKAMELCLAARVGMPSFFSRKPKRQPQERPHHRKIRTTAASRESDQSAILRTILRR